MKFVSYDPEGFYDEMFSPDGEPRSYSRILFDRVQSLDDDELKRRHRAAESALMRMGITFNVYGAEQGTERIGRSISFPGSSRPRNGNGWSVGCGNASLR